MVQWFGRVVGVCRFFPVLRVNRVNIVRMASGEAENATPRDRTFQYQDSLPSLPLPTLKDTLDKYLYSVKPHVTEEEYKKTEAVVKEFETGSGKELHKKLLDRAKTHRNWLSEWWYNFAYLEPRYPTPVYVNISGPSPAHEHYWPPQDGSQLERAGLALWHTLNFWKLMKNEEWPVDKMDRGKTPCSMEQYKHLFNTCKIPGEKRDKIVSHFKTVYEGESPTHLCVLHAGRIFTVEVIDDNNVPYTPPELQGQLTVIKEKCAGQPAGPGVGALTSEQRTKWWQLRNRLIELDSRNQQHLEAIEKSLICFTLDDTSPSNDSEITTQGLTGDCFNRWFDKSYNNLMFNNGTLASNCDHAAFDGIVLVVLNLYMDQKIIEARGIWKGTVPERKVPEPKELVFTIDEDMGKAIQDAALQYQEMASDLQVHCLKFMTFGKNFTRSHKLHPDGLIQLSLQLAYYRTYGKPAPTYETASTRKFYMGRTETCRTCTPEAVAFCRAMVDRNTTSAEKLQALRTANEKFIWLMGECILNRGCDRHLLGLQILSDQAGMTRPDIYTDPAWTKSGGGGNFVLSTSTSGYTSAYGGCAPMRHDGYGSYYKIQDNRLTICVTAWKSNKETCAEKMAGGIEQALLDIQQLCTSSRM
ncbi:peroxisomal carnitine O-octanoyltransferase-like isoform X1 [Branchiostoma lanceolatum]|uniref:peroxisomal carnitine O-octanoyltransferase-like isoform X1 n=2 Tax=Branchiostoma lanceolatum TaxID=7740 RepID=UPI0034555F4E